MIAVVVLLLALAVLVLVCLFALIDQYRTLEIVRQHLGVDDAPRPIDHPRGEVVAAAVGLPARLDDLPQVTLLFLSTSCSTCQAVATALRGRSLPTLHVVLKAPSAQRGAEWLRDVGLDPAGATIDVGGRVAAGLMVDITPSALLLHDRHVTLAQTIPSARQLEPLLTGRGLPKAAPHPQEHR